MVKLKNDRSGISSLPYDFMGTYRDLPLHNVYGSLTNKCIKHEWNDGDTEKFKYHEENVSLD